MRSESGICQHYATKNNDMIKIAKKAKGKPLNFLTLLLLSQGLPRFFPFLADDAALLSRRYMKAAAYVGTRNVYQDILPSLKSLLINSDVDRVYLLIEDDVFPYELPDCVETINVSDQPYFSHDGPNYHGMKWTWMTMMRAALAKVFPDLDVILSLDNDTIIDQDISEIWDLPIDDYYYAASREPLKSKGGQTYVCDLFTQMGVVLYNLKKLRDGKADEVIDELNRHRYIFAEQDAFNMLCQGYIYPMPSMYNVCDYTEPATYKKIYHFAAIWEWQSFPEVLKYKDIPWEKIPLPRGV